jgi:hypothetical protein
MSIEVKGTSAETAFRQMAKDQELPEGQHCLKVIKQTVKANEKEDSAWSGFAMVSLGLKSVDPETGADFNGPIANKYLLTTAVTGEPLPGSNKKGAKTFDSIRSNGVKDLVAVAKACGLITEATPEAVDALSRGLCDDSLTFEGCEFFANVKYNTPGGLPEMKKIQADPIADTPLAYEQERAPF